MMGECYKKLGELRSAIEWISKALDQIPDNPLYLVNRGL